MPYFSAIVENMLNNIKIYTVDKYWAQILTDLGANITDSPNLADIVFDDINIDTPISIPELQQIIFDCTNNMDIIVKIFGKNVYLPTLQHKIIVLLDKNNGLSITDIKNALGVLPDVTTHVVENAIYQLRKTYGHEFIVNNNGKYTIGHI